MSRVIAVGLLGTALVFTLIYTALIGNIIASNVDGHMILINFSMFVAALSWVTVLWGLLAAFFAFAAFPLILLVLIGLTVLFTFVNAISLAAETEAPNCGNIRGAGLPRNWIGYGSNDNEGRCRELQAATAFVWFLWAVLCGSLFFAFKEWRGYGGSGRSSRPSMSQVGV